MEGRKTLERRIDELKKVITSKTRSYIGKKLETDSGDYRGVEMIMVDQYTTSYTHSFRERRKAFKEIKSISKKHDEDWVQKSVWLIFYSKKRKIIDGINAGIGLGVIGFFTFCSLFYVGSCFKGHYDEWRERKDKFERVIPSSEYFRDEIRYKENILRDIEYSGNSRGFPGANCGWLEEGIGLVDEEDNSNKGFKRRNNAKYLLGELKSYCEKLEDTERTISWTRRVIREKFEKGYLTPDHENYSGWEEIFGNVGWWTSKK